MRHTSQDFIVTVFGLVTSLVTAVVLLFVEEHLNLAFYSLMVWFVIPIGAMVSGLVAASGYYLGSILFGHKPTRLLLINIVLLSVGTFFTIYWFRYASLKVDGQSVMDLIPFSQYMDIVLRHQTMEVHFHSYKDSTGELGGFGYGIAALQIIGFAGGGVAVFGYLSSLPYCHQCSKYLRGRSKQVRYSTDAVGFKTMSRSVAYRINSGKVQEAIDIHAKFGDARQDDNGGNLKATLERKQCPVCSGIWLKLSAEKLDGNQWKDIEGLKCSRFQEGELRA